MVCWRRLCRTVAVLCAAVIAMLAATRDAHAIPSFARKYKTSCTTCHTVYPMLNPFGEAFRRNGYRFPSSDASLDSDSVKAETVALGQEDYKKVFPEAVWPDTLMEGVPLSAQVNGDVSYNLPKSSAHDAAGHAFSWDSIVSEFHLFAGGAFNDTLTYFAEATFASDGLDLEHGYLLWSDIVGPAHLVNLWAGRRAGASLTSWGLHSSYLSDTFLPQVSVVGLQNPTGTFSLGLGHTDGVEVNGIVEHWVDYSIGWVASHAAAGLSTPNSEDAYAHVGFKVGGMSLDGEGAGGTLVKNPMRPWEETSLTLDAFCYHGLSLLDNGTGGPDAPIGQDDRVNAFGGAARLQLQSLTVTAGMQYEHHTQPHQGLSDGSEDPRAGNAYTQYDEINYLVYPWFVPGVRAEYTRVRQGKVHVLRLVPGIAMLVRPNIKVVVAAEIDQAEGVPPAGDWSAAGVDLQPDQGTSKLEAEAITASLAWAF
jgi:hypothetical protein